MKLIFHELHISQHTILSILNSQDKRKNKLLTSYGEMKILNQQYYARIQCSFMNLFRNSQFKKL